MFGVCTLVCDLAPWWSLFIHFVKSINYCFYIDDCQPLLLVFSIFASSKLSGSELINQCRQQTGWYRTYRKRTASDFSLF
uniref:Putative secreted protein n=1 Tax=Ixodes ricinus TaxID=34613 RepID=A0A6B0U1K5_IXORI